MTGDEIQAAIDQEFDKLNIWGIPKGSYNRWNYEALKRHVSYANRHPTVFQSWGKTQLHWALQDYFVKIHQEMARPECTFENYHEQLVEELVTWLMLGFSAEFDFNGLANYVIIKYHGKD